ncbi:MAG: ABC transporter ATP-binding protein [Clostridia bacterium]
MEKVIELKSIVKRFGSVLANDHIDFELYLGETHALLGENGAGKSSLMNVLAGVYQPDSGQIYFNGERVDIPSPRHSIDMGIGMIHQHFKLIEAHTVLENMMAGMSKGFLLNKKKHYKQVVNLSRRYGLDIDPNSIIEDLSVAQKQRVEILKVLFRGANILILDEPTAVLTPQEAKKLFSIIDNLKKNNHAIVFISHKLDEVLAVSDRITVLRNGKNIATLKNEDLDANTLISNMVGQSLKLEIERPKVMQEDIILEVKDLSVLRPDGAFGLKNVGFDLHKGEILGVAGLAGSGQKELCESIVGLIDKQSGSVIFKGNDISKNTPRDIIKKGISMSFVPEDRLGMGLVASMDLTDNVLLKSYLKQPGLFVDRDQAKENAKSLVKKLNIDTPSVDITVSKLSGGNIQKVLLGRELELQPELIITAYPARGLDIGSAYKIYDLLNEQKVNGHGVIFIGEDLDVLLEISDRLMVLCNGEVTGIVNPEEVTKEDVGYMMVGRKPEGMSVNV